MKLESIQLSKRIRLSALVFISTAFILSMIHIKTEEKMLVLERFIDGGGWIEIVIVSIYGALLGWFMLDVKKSAQWRLFSWTVFSVWFFLQLFLGILVSDRFLLTGKLHLPVPAMIICGPIYRGQLSVMTILFLSTIILTGPAWCSHLCYFGAIDGQMAKGKRKNRSILNRNSFRTKATLVLMIILASLILRWFRVKPLIATIAGAFLGFSGVLFIMIYSRKTGKMTHCLLYCPVGTLVNYLKYINPFRMDINTNCTLCMACSPVCKYDALNVENIKNRIPGKTCTLCGDCLKSCKEQAIQYQLFRLSPEKSRNIYLFITITVHSIFLAMGRI